MTRPELTLHLWGRLPLWALGNCLASAWPRGSAASPKGEENAEHVRQTVTAPGSASSVAALCPFLSISPPGRDVVELLCLKGSCYCKAGKLNLPIGHRNSRSKENCRGAEAPADMSTAATSEGARKSANCQIISKNIGPLLGRAGPGSSLASPFGRLPGGPRAKKVN